MRKVFTEAEVHRVSRDLAMSIHVCNMNPGSQEIYYVSLKGSHILVFNVVASMNFLRKQKNMYAGYPTICRRLVVTDLKSLSGHTRHIAIVNSKKCDKFVGTELPC
jgi:hypothetical protein